MTLNLLYSLAGLWKMTKSSVVPGADTADTLKSFFVWSEWLILTTAVSLFLVDDVACLILSDNGTPSAYDIHPRSISQHSSSFSLYPFPFLSPR